MIRDMGLGLLYVLVVATVVVFGKGGSGNGLVSFVILDVQGPMMFVYFDGHDGNAHIDFASQHVCFRISCTGRFCLHRGQSYHYL